MPANIHKNQYNAIKASNKDGSLLLNERTQRNEQNLPCSHWKVWSAAEALSSGGNSSLLKESRISAQIKYNDINQMNMQCTEITPKKRTQALQVLAHEASVILREWGHRWAGNNEFQSILNKSSLLHEVEESIIAIHFLLEWLSLQDKQSPTGGINDINTSPEYIIASKDHSIPKNDVGGKTTKDNGITVVDLCCGKGIFSMLLSYMAARLSPFCYPLRHITMCIMVEKETEQTIKWEHIHRTNEDALPGITSLARIPIKIWGGCNIHDENMLSKLEGLPGKLAVVGIHLCKTLGPRCVGLYNCLGAAAPFLCFAPCCLPRITNRKANGIIKINLFETNANRKNRDKDKRMRDQALGMGRQKLCFICQSRGHRVRHCPSLPVEEEERKKKLKHAAMNAPCWRCGVIGHTKANCPSSQMSSKPSVRSVPTIDIDVSSLSSFSATNFGLYCERLASAIQIPHDCGKVEVVDIPLSGTSFHGHGTDCTNTRKSKFIVTER